MECSGNSKEASRARKETARQSTAQLLGIHTQSQIKRNFPSRTRGEKSHLTASISDELLGIAA